jgi:hypothetical protein
MSLRRRVRPREEMVNEKTPDPENDEAREPVAKEPPATQPRPSAELSDGQLESVSGGALPHALTPAAPSPIPIPYPNVSRL